MLHNGQIPKEEDCICTVSFVEQHVFYKIWLPQMQPDMLHDGHNMSKILK